MNGQDEIFTVKARRCKRCGGLLTNKNTINDGYGHVCKMKMLTGKHSRGPMQGQITLGDLNHTNYRTEE